MGIRRLPGRNASVNERGVGRYTSNTTMAYFGENWDDREFPLAYLITIRTYGMWLHGDERGSVDQHGRFSRYGATRRSDDPGLEARMRENLDAPPIALNERQRVATDVAIKEVCSVRIYDLFALNVRPTHAHAVVSGKVKPELIANSFKSYATRKLRADRLIHDEQRVWSRGRSRRYLWEDRYVSAAIDYVLYGQGDEDFEVWAEENGRLIDIEPPDRHAS
ncbi:MAG: transposase [Pyrinomonadaceae bacterium]